MVLSFFVEGEFSFLSFAWNVEEYVMRVVMLKLNCFFFYRKNVHMRGFNAVVIKFNVD